MLQQHSLRAITRINEMGPSVEISRTERSPSSRKQRSDSGTKQPLGSNSDNIRCATSTASPTTAAPSRRSPNSSSANRSDSNDKEYSAIYNLVPPWMTDLPVALHMRARMAFELTEYHSAKEILQKLRKMYPHRTEVDFASFLSAYCFFSIVLLKGMELLSTALWHLQDAHELSSLAQHLTIEARFRPQTWCVAGNCFSLQRQVISADNFSALHSLPNSTVQHAKAVDCMERAIQLDPYFAYAYTLLGHELIFQEEYDRAANAFRRALEISPKDYRAWHGLGLVHLRKEQMGLAQVNISKAVTINPTNRAMLCQLAQIEQALNRPERAMRLIDRALVLDPDDVACRYNRARLLFDTKHNEECVKELNELKEVSPDEAYIYHLLGKVHRRLGNNHLALLNYSWATEMDPRGEQMLGHAGERSYDDDDPSPTAS
ncbi:tetratricopeptide repeat protein [Cooperia oncophora]